MRIAQVSPLYESLPPKGYGGTERVVSYLTEELVRQGHEVTVFASGDLKSSTMASKSFALSKWEESCVRRVSRNSGMIWDAGRAESKCTAV